MHRTLLCINAVQLLLLHLSITNLSLNSEEDSDFGKKTLFRDFTLSHLEALLADKKDQYKRCYLNIKTWHSAVAEVIEPGEDGVDRIYIKQKRNLERAFDKDEVVVHIDKSVSTKL